MLVFAWVFMCGGCHTNTSLCTQSWGVSHQNLTVCTCSVLKLDQCGVRDEVGVSDLWCPTSPCANSWSRFTTLCVTLMVVCVCQQLE